MNKSSKNDGQVIIFLSFVPFFFKTVAFILFADGITISPEIGLRNSTQQHNLLPQLSKRMDDSAEILVDGSGAPMQHQRNQTQIERHRRLIPYMTFYLPATNNDLKLPINQAYNFMQAPSTVSNE